VARIVVGQAHHVLHAVGRLDVAALGGADLLALAAQRLDALLLFAHQVVELHFRHRVRLRCGRIARGRRRRGSDVALLGQVLDLGEPHRLQGGDLLGVLDLEAAEQEGMAEPAVELDVQSDADLLDLDSVPPRPFRRHCPSLVFERPIVPTLGSKHRISICAASPFIGIAPPPHP